MKQKENKKQKRYNHSFAQRLTRWVMLVLFVMMSILGYIVYDMSKSIALSFSVNTFHTNMKASARFLSSVMADVSDAVKNHLYEVEQHMGQPALLKQTMARIITLNPRIRKCDIDYVRDNAMPDMLREVAAADSACWSFFDNFRLYFFGGNRDIVGIETLTSEEADKDKESMKVYDLNGRQLNTQHLKPGIYIIRGKKVVIK